MPEMGQRSFTEYEKAQCPTSTLKVLGSIFEWVPSTYLYLIPNREKVPITYLLNRPLLPVFTNTLLHIFCMLSLYTWVPTYKKKKDNLNMKNLHKIHSL